MSDAPSLSGPDLERGVAAGDVRDGQALVGHAHGAAVMLVREGATVAALGATCSHYGGPLGEGLVSAGTVRCPWHHACFDIATGEALGGPALAPVDCFEVIHEGSLVRVGAKRAAAARTPASPGPSSVVVVGAGPAGTACAVALRQEGYAGPITLVGAELPGPVDRPNLSKDFLAGSAPEEWIPLRTFDALAEQNIALVADDAVTKIDTAARTVTLTSGRSIAWGALVLATGARANTLDVDGASLPHVHTLRTLADARAIIAALPAAKRAVVIGASFIGLEAAASLRKRGLEVTVVAPHALPLARLLGDDVGRFVKRVHEEAGVVFHVDAKPAGITATHVTLDDGARLPADVVVVGVGVRPATELAEGAGLMVKDGVVVDESLRTSAADVYAVGDVARYPYGGSLVRVEHFAVAERHGQAIARALVGRAAPYREVPFFWSQHHDVTLSYVGHTEGFDAAEVRGDLAARDATVAYRKAGRVVAALTVGRDGASLRIQRAMELGDDAEVEALVGAAP